MKSSFLKFSTQPNTNHVFFFFPAIALFVSLIINIFVVAVFAEVEVLFMILAMWNNIRTMYTS